MAPRIRAERNASAKSKSAARAKADAHFTPKGSKAKAEVEEAKTHALKSVTMDLGLAPRADVLHHLKTLKGLNKKKDDVVALIRNARKRAKESNVDPLALDAAIKWQDRDPVEFAKWLAGIVQACEVNDIKVPQINFFDESALSPVEKAQQDGHRAGISGMSHTANPHDPNSDSGRAWEEFRQRGQAELASEGIGKGAEAKPSDLPPEQQDKLFDEADNDADETDDETAVDGPNPASVKSPAADAARAAGIGAH